MDENVKRNRKDVKGKGKIVDCGLENED